jgi:hypothetical protein
MPVNDWRVAMFRHDSADRDQGAYLMTRRNVRLSNKADVIREGRSVTFEAAAGIRIVPANC